MLRQVVLQALHLLIEIAEPAFRPAHATFSVSFSISMRKRSMSRVPSAENAGRTRRMCGPSGIIAGYGRFPERWRAQIQLWLSLPPGASWVNGMMSVDVKGKSEQYGSVEIVSSTAPGWDGPGTPIFENNLGTVGERPSGLLYFNAASQR